jgi:DNA-binding winged helix-turn-helix (wHTH) protein
MEICMYAQSTRRAQDLYSFGEFTLDVPDRRLTRHASPVHLAPKTHDVLVALIRRAGRLVTKHELLEGVWPDIFVNEGILTVHVAALRKAFGDRKRSPVYIETVSRSGYRFIATVTHASTLDAAPTEPSTWRDREVQP